MMCFAFAQAMRRGTNTGAASSAVVYTTHCSCKQWPCIYTALLCKNLLGSIPNPLTVQHPPGAALQLRDSVDLNKIAA